ncbi:uncharacterized protein VTP21DRAFT_7737 [Calcarisporiella thermophila]|uniref:uncharacterized protein n=1 Tax=Calcarisporiella thermophila TaxID=911321 RepID=UPI003742ECB3
MNGINQRTTPAFAPLNVKLRAALDQKRDSELKSTSPQETQIQGFSSPSGRILSVDEILQKKLIRQKESQPARRAIPSFIEKLSSRSGTVGAKALQNESVLTEDLSVEVKIMRPAREAHRTRWAQEEHRRQAELREFESVEEKLFRDEEKFVTQDSANEEAPTYTMEERRGWRNAGSAINKTPISKPLSTVTISPGLAYWLEHGKTPVQARNSRPLLLDNLEDNKAKDWEQERCKLGIKRMKGGGLVERERTREKKTESDYGVDARIKSLEKELDEYRDELEKTREEVIRLRQELQITTEELREAKIDKPDFEQYKKEERNKLEKWKAQEMKKLQRERQLWERNRRAVEMMPGKKDREEAEHLRKQLAECQKSLQAKESRHKVEEERLQKQVDDLTLQNEKLLAEVVTLKQEKLALSRIPVPASTIKRSSSATTKVERPLSASSTVPPTVSRTTSTKSSTTPYTSTTTSSAFGLATTKGKDPIERNNAKKEPCALDSLEEQIENLGVCIQDDQPTEKDSPRTRIYSSGSRLQLFPNGTIKHLEPSGRTTSFFTNGDRKIHIPGNRTVYHFANGTETIRFADGIEETRFPNGQIQRREGNVIEVRHPTGIVQRVVEGNDKEFKEEEGAEREEEVVFGDGTVMTVRGGVKRIRHPDGTEEIQCDAYHRRVLPDGTIETLWADGVRQIVSKK